MSEDMVERVARAIAEVVNVETTGDYDIGGDIAVKAARAAIEAMRNPTEAMLDRRPWGCDADDADTWRAMIDAALSPPTPGALE